MNAYLFSSVYILTASFVVFLFQNHLVQMFNAKGDAALLVHFFCNYIAVTFVFNGQLFIANATFNNLGKPTFSTLLNWLILSGTRQKSKRKSLPPAQPLNPKKFHCPAH